jgi:hypothetical protein
VRLFLARVGAEPAGAGALWIDGEVAALFSTATRTPFRRRGVHGALLHARLAAAIAAGCEWATVQTVPGSDSQRNVERHGFAVAYTKPTLARD